MLHNTQQYFENVNTSLIIQMLDCNVFCNSYVNDMCNIYDKIQSHIIQHHVVMLQEDVERRKRTLSFSVYEIKLQSEHRAHTKIYDPQENVTVIQEKLLYNTTAVHTKTDTLGTIARSSASTEKKRVSYANNLYCHKAHNQSHWHTVLLLIVCVYVYYRYFSRSYFLKVEPSEFKSAGTKQSLTEQPHKGILSHSFCYQLQAGKRLHIVIRHIIMLALPVSLQFQKKQHQKTLKTAVVDNPIVV